MFGVGGNSELWLKCNKGGNTIFIEHERKWIKAVKKRLPDINIFKVKYNTIKAKWKMLIDNPRKLNMKLSKKITDIVWDIIFIDAPQGYNSKKPGRMKSIFSASQLKYKHILIHDSDREIEREYGNKYCSKLIFNVDRLNHYIKV